MRCLACDQVLWSLPAPPDGAPRACPECGEAYRIRDYRFRRGKVSFCCPHCAHAHPGESPRGLPILENFDCAGCGRAISTESCVARPAAGVDERDAVLAKELPWLGKGAFVVRWWRTMALGYSGGVEVAEMLGRRAPALPAALFLCTTVWVARSLGVLVTVADFAGLFARLGIPTRSPDAVTAAAAFIGAPGIALVAAAAAAGLVHLAARSQGLDFHRAFSRIAFCSGGLALGIIPCIGVLGSVVWTIQACYAVSHGLRRGTGVPAVLAVIAGIVGTMLAAASLGPLRAVLVGL